MKNTFKVKVTRRGSVTLPKELRAQNRINEGDMLTLINLKNSIFVMSLRRSRVDEIANKLAREWQESGETLEIYVRSFARRPSRM